MSLSLGGDHAIIPLLAKPDAILLLIQKYSKFPSLIIIEAKVIEWLMVY